MLQEIFDAQKNFYLNSDIPDFQERTQRISAIESCIRTHKNEIAKALNLDLGKSLFESYFSEIEYVLDEIIFIKKHLRYWMKTRRVWSHWLQFPAKSIILREPLGQVLAMAPWNYPFQLALTPVVAALAAGNTVILKPSEMAPHTSQLMEKIFSDLDPRIFKVVLGDAQTAEKLLNLDFDFCFFTGSTPVGKKVMEQAAKKLIPVCLELGGKSPALVDASANIDLSARKIVYGKFFNAGQTCVAPDYVWAHESIYESLLEKLKFYTLKFYGTDPKASEDFGRIINEKHFERLKNLHRSDLCVLGGEWDLAKRFVPPSIYKDVTWNDELMKDEIFGPLLPVLKFKDWTEVQSVLLKKPKPLAFYLFSNDKELNAQVLKRFPFGGGCVNDCIIQLANPRLPFGGVGASGMGAYHGRYGFDLMSHQKAVAVQKQIFDFDAKYPPYTWAKKYLNFINK